MATKTIAEVIAGMRDEVKWFRNSARTHSHNFSKTAGVTRIAELVDQEADDRVANKLEEWAERLEKVNTNGNN